MTRRAAFSRAWIGILFALALSPGASASSRGPDAFGYCFLDSQEERGPALKFRTIAGNGGGGVLDPSASLVPADSEAPPIVLGDDEVSSPIPLPFPFVFYGEVQTSLRVSSNGFVLFGDSTDPAPVPQAIPSPGGPGPLIAAYWSDLDPASGIAAVTHRTIGELGRRVFDLQFTRVPHASGIAPVTFQIELYEGTNEIEVRYPDTPSDGTIHSAGIQGPGGTAGLQYRFGDFSFSPAAPMAVRYVPPGDRDDDGLPDCEELLETGTDPTDADSDGDGFGDGIEVRGGSCAGLAVAGGSDPNNPLSTPVVDTGLRARPGPYPLPTICR